MRREACRGDEVMELVELNSASKRFNGREVLKGIDLSIPRGRVVGLLGKNGAGKTTLIKCLLGLLKLDAGTVRLFGEDVRRLSGATKERIGYVPQEVDLYPWMRVRQTISYIAAFYSNWDERLAQELVGRWELNPEEKVSSLSVGQVQKLALILALAHQPELLILDEPAASLDPSARRTFLSAVIEIASDANRTVLLSTHLTSDLERVASDVVLLKSGAVDYVGSMDELKDSIKSLRLTSERLLPKTLEVPGVLNCETGERQALLTVRGVTPELIHTLEVDYDATVEVRDLNLEDIFVEVHRA
jgi:ABC-2 type transport system ATP-binding protein